MVAVLAATVEDDSNVTGGRASRVRSVGDGVVALPTAAASLSDRVRVLRWEIVTAGEPHILSRQSPPPLYRLRDGGPPASSWAGPRSGREVKGQVGRWTNWWRSIPTLLMSYSF